VIRFCSRKLSRETSTREGRISPSRNLCHDPISWFSSLFTASSRGSGACDLDPSNIAILRSSYSFEGIGGTRSSATEQHVYALCYADQGIKKIWA